MARWPTKAKVALLVGAAGGFGLAALERSDAGQPEPEAAPRTAPRDETPRGAAPSPVPDLPGTEASRPAFTEARCPGDAGNCRAVTARVIAIESVDPDGDGDLHVVAVGGSVTAPGITVFDVGPALRPARDPRIGQRVTGAGPVFRGSFGQRQIEVTEFRVDR